MAERHMSSVRLYKIVLFSLSIVLMFTLWSELTLRTIVVGATQKPKLCYVNFIDNRSHLSASNKLPTIYFVTPTYPRPEQIPELTRLSHTLMHVPKIHWIIADDQVHCSDEVYHLLRRTGLPYTHISSPKPPKPLITKHVLARGVANRLAALDWLKNNTLKGVLYFGDDDNTVDLELFEEIRKTKIVSMFPVGLIGLYGVSAPVVKNGKVIGFFDSWSASRKFPVDMAGFAVNLESLIPTATMPFVAGHEEDQFLTSLGITLDDIEPLASNCSRILVWHTRTAKTETPTVNINIKKLEEISVFNNLAKLLKETERFGMAKFSTINGHKPLISKNRKTFDLKLWANKQV